VDIADIKEGIEDLNIKELKEPESKRT